MAEINYSEKIPNNVNLGRRPHAAARAGALAAELPQLVGRHGARTARATYDVYLRTAVSVDRAGLGAVRPREDAGLPLGHFPRRRRSATRKIHFGEHKGEPAWQDVPGEYRANLRRIIVTQGDTEPASVEQQRHLGLTAPVALRPAQPVSGQRRGGPPPVGHGLPAARALRPRRPRGGGGAARSAARATPTIRASSAPSTSRRPTGFRSSCSPPSPTATASSSCARWPSPASIRWRAPTSFMLTEEAHHMFVGEIRHRRASSSAPATR